MRHLINIVESASYPVLYHGTRAENVDEIMRIGLTPEMDQSSREWPEGVYLTDSLHVAKTYGPVVLAIRTSALDLHEMYPDDHELADYFEGDNVIDTNEIDWPAEYAELKGATPDEVSHFINWRVSLILVQQCKYAATIPPEAISVAGDLKESIDRPFPISWKYQKPDYWFGTFMVDDEEYCVSANLQNGFPDPDEPDQDGQWFDLAFGLVRDGFSGTKVLGTGGKAFAIFATAIVGFEQFIDAEKPRLIMLSASKDNPNRFPLYKRLARRFEPDLRARGFRPCDAPEYRFIATLKDFDALAWRRD